jgi:hypothetical protein
MSNHMIGHVKIWGKYGTNKNIRAVIQKEACGMTQ